MAGSWSWVARTEEGRATDSAEVYDASSDTWSTAAKQTERRSRHSMTLLPDGRVMVAGGFGEGANLASTEIYDPHSDTWSAASDMTQSRRFHTATLLADGRVLVAGGMGQGQAVLASAETYDPISNTWALTSAAATNP